MNRPTQAAGSQSPDGADSGLETDEQRRQVEDVIRLAGPRQASLSEREFAKHRAAALAVWQRGVQRTRFRSRYRTTVAGLLAAAGLLLAFTFVWRQRAAPSLQPVATVASLVGEVDMRSRGAQSWRRIEAGEELPAGSELRTGADSFAHVATDDGAAVRWAANTTARIAGLGSLELSGGEIYLETGADGASARSPVSSAAPDETSRYTVATSLGTVQDIGTRFAVLARAEETVVRVRSGRAQFRPIGPEKTAVEAKAGEEVRVARSGGVTRRALSASDGAWSWTLRVPKTFDLEGSNLASYLEWLQTETGWTIHFLDPTMEQQAPTVVLHGSINELDPRQTLDLVLPAAALDFALEGDRLTIL